MMILYDSEQEIIGRTQEIFNDEIQYEFSGFNTDDDYYIELQVRSQDDLLATTAKFILQFAMKCL